MRAIVRKDRMAAAFTIVELLTVMSIIVILMGMLMPALTRVRRYALDVRQHAQFHAIDVAMELYNNELEGYPDSDEEDGDGADYCGAMKLAEAMMGQDLLGFHPRSLFNSDGRDGADVEEFYPLDPAKGGSMPLDEYRANLKERKGPYLQLETANAYRLKNIFGVGNAVSASASFEEERFALCDVYRRVTLRDDPADTADDVVAGKRVGMPILYYKANVSNMLHIETDAANSIYNYIDNHEFIDIKPPWDSTGSYEHELHKDDGENFYINTKNEQIYTTDRPHRSDSYILISAGFDGEYGTADDIYNFNK